MEEHCPLELADNLVNPDQYKGSIDYWRDEVSRDVILEKRASLVNWLAGRIENGEKVVWEGSAEGGKGRGIVMTGGNKVSHRNGSLNWACGRSLYSTPIGYGRTTDIPPSAPPSPWQHAPH
jgi:hypothetical protein